MNTASDSLRIPPCAIDVEQQLIAGLMADSSQLVNVADWLTEKDLYLEKHRLLWRAITTLAGRGSPVDPVTMEDWLADQGLSGLIEPGYLIEIANGPGSPANVVAYAEIIATRARLREAIDVGARLTESAWAPGAVPSEVIASAVRDLTHMSPERRGGLESVKPALRRLNAQMLKRYEMGDQNRLLGIPTPWKEVNDLTKGLRDATLYVVAARPSMGKSVFGGQIAVFTALRHHRTALFSVEASAEQCLARAVSCISEVDYEWVQLPDNKDPEQDLKWQRITDANAALLDAPLLIDETPAMAVHQFLARARRAHMQAPLRLIVLDHMHDMQLNPDRVRFDLGEIAQAGKTLAKECNCPVVLLAQLNRNVANRADKRPTLTDLRESGEIEQKGDVILFLHREDYYNRTVMPGVVEVIPGKGRDLRIDGPIYLQNRYDQMRLEDWRGPLPDSPNNVEGFRRAS